MNISEIPITIEFLGENIPRAAIFESNPFNSVSCLIRRFSEGRKVSIPSLEEFACLFTDL